MPLVEVIPGKVSGVPLLNNTRLPAGTVLSNFESGPPVEEIADNFDIPSRQSGTLLAYGSNQQKHSGRLGDCMTRSREKLAVVPFELSLDMPCVSIAVMDPILRKYTSFEEMKADEYRYWQSRPAHERMDAVEEMIQAAYKLKGWEMEPDVPRLQRPFVRLPCPWR